MDSIRVLREEVAPELCCSRTRLRQVDGPLRSILGRLASILRSNDLAEAMQEGWLTFGMVKPELTRWGNEQLTGLGEDEALGLIMQTVREKLQVVVAHSMTWDRNIFERFRSSNHERMIARSSNLGFPNVWEEENALMTRGPATPMLLEGRNAMDTWRKMIGNANPIKAAPETIRGRFGRTISNNLVHGASAQDYGCPVITLRHEIGCWADNVELLATENLS